MGYDADALVVGGGPAGCTAAIRLALAGHDTLVLEREPEDTGEDLTSGELMHPVAQRECQALGVELSPNWAFDRLAGVRNVYPDLSWTYHRYREGFGYVHLDRGGFNLALRARLRAVGGRLLNGARMTDLAFRPDAVVVRTASGGEYSARLLIDAAGRNSRTLYRLGLKSEETEFHQIGVSVFFASFADAPLHTWDRHLYGENGAMLSGSRIRPGLYRYILEANLAEKQAEGLRPLDYYLATAAKYDPWLSVRIQREPRVGKVWSMAPLGYRVAEVARDRLLFAGDAAGYLSPITGQGIEFAMRMGRLAAEAAAGAIRSGDCSAAAFAPYIEGRRSEVLRQTDEVRRQLRVFSDRAALLRAAHDDEFRLELFGPRIGPAVERGTLVGT